MTTEFHNYCCWSMILLTITHAVPLTWNPTSQSGNVSGELTSQTLNTNQVCKHENVEYTEGQTHPTSNPCEVCTCQPPGFACNLRICEVRPGCKALHSAGKCCPEYVCDCHRNGRTYGNGEKVEEPNPCNVCYCRGGEIQCTGVTCYTRNDCEPHYVPGKCCPKYDHCPPIEIKNKPAFVSVDAVTTAADSTNDTLIITATFEKTETPESNPVGKLEIIEIYPSSVQQISSTESNIYGDDCSQDEELKIEKVEERLIAAESNANTNHSMEQFIETASSVGTSSESTSESDILTSTDATEKSDNQHNGKLLETTTATDDTVATAGQTTEQMETTTNISDSTSTTAMVSQEKYMDLTTEPTEDYSNTTTTEEVIETTATSSDDFEILTESSSSYLTENVGKLISTVEEDKDIGSTVSPNNDTDLVDTVDATIDPLNNDSSEIDTTSLNPFSENTTDTESTPEERNLEVVDVPENETANTTEFDSNTDEPPEHEDITNTSSSSNIEPEYIVPDTELTPTDIYEPELLKVPDETEEYSTVTDEGLQNVTLSSSEDYEISENASRTPEEKEGTLREFTLPNIEGIYQKNKTPEKVVDAVSTTQMTQTTLPFNINSTIIEVLQKWLKVARNNTNKIKVSNTDTGALTVIPEGTPVSLLTALSTELMKMVRDMPSDIESTTKAAETDSTNGRTSSRGGATRSLDLPGERNERLINSTQETFSQPFEDPETGAFMKNPFNDESLAPVLSMISDQLQFLKVGEEQPLYVDVPPPEEESKQEHEGVIVTPTAPPITVEMVKVVGTTPQGAPVTNQTTDNT